MRAEKLQSKHYFVSNNDIKQTPSSRTSGRLQFLRYLMPNNIFFPYNKGNYTAPNLIQELLKPFCLIQKSCCLHYKSQYGASKEFEKNINLDSWV